MSAADSVLAERVSVVLLTYNCAHRIDVVLDHLCDLGVPVVAVDNASADRTVERLRARTQLEVVPLTRNIGAAGRNVGVAHVRTPYVAFCDDDGWFEPPALRRAVERLDDHPRLALINARIDVGEHRELDPISAEMAQSPLPETAGVPGRVLLGFMAGAVVMRVSAFREVGGYHPRFFIGGEEETLALPLAARGWHLRYVDDVVVRHRPSIANAPHLRAVAMRNTLWNAWLRRRPVNALRWTAFILLDTPKNGDWLRGVRMALAGLPWVLRRRAPVARQLDRELAVLDARRFARRRSVWNRHDPLVIHRTVAPGFTSRRRGIGPVALKPVATRPPRELTS